eukprot:s572_g15.t1
METESDDVSDAALLKQLCFPYSTAEPQLSDSELLRIDTLADHLEISRLKAMGVLLPTEGYDYAGQRNGSQMWHDAFSGFLRDELKITPCDAYPCLLRAADSECVLLLHVDDVLCLVKETYLNETLVPALKGKYKIALDVVCKEGDELTFLKRKHVMVGSIKAVTYVKMDNSAGRSFLLRSGVGRIRHISVRVLWMQQRVKEKGLIPSRVPSRDNPADLGTKRLSKDRMEYLMCMCKVFNMDTSEYVGMSAYDKIQEQDNMKTSIRLLKEQGYSAPKQLFRILLLALSPGEMAAMSSISDAALDPSSTDGAWSFIDVKSALIAILITMLCGAVGFCFYLRYALGKARGEVFATKMDKVLHEVLDELEYRLGWIMWDPNNHETPQQKRRRYLDSEMCEVSDVEYWTLMHYGPPLSDDAETSEESSMENDEMVRHSAHSAELRETMLETNQLLRNRVERLECEYDEAELANNIDAMAVLEAQIIETRGLMYAGLDDA